MVDKSSKYRLDNRLVGLGLVASRSQAESFIKLGSVTIDGIPAKKPGQSVSSISVINIIREVRYVNRGALKLESISQTFNLDFRHKNVLDVGSSTGGFTDYALQNGANKVFAVELGTDQLHPSLKGSPRIELHEKTDILNVDRYGSDSSNVKLSFIPDIIVIDLSFISLRQILGHLSHLSDYDTLIVAMVKPQFEAANSNLKHKGVIKNETIRRSILRDFEEWAISYFNILNKADSKVAGSKGNLERFYLLKKTKLTKIPK